MIQDIKRAFIFTKKNYDAGLYALDDAFEVGSLCLQTLQNSAHLGAFGEFSGSPTIQYWVARTNSSLSRPYRPDLFIHDPREFGYQASLLIQDLKNEVRGSERLDSVIYTTVTAFSLCFDLWQPKSRKTPGTFFEVLIGSAARVRLKHLELSKHIPIRDLPVKEEIDALENSLGFEDKVETVESIKGESVSTDLVLTDRFSMKGAVIPLKITTRERIVQPFAHQRILDSAYSGKFASFLACISEVQRDDKTNTVKQVCVPGTVALFQKHLAKLNGLYYCDIPQRYARSDLQSVIAVKPLHCLFDDVEAHLSSYS